MEEAVMRNDMTRRLAATLCGIALLLALLASAGNAQLRIPRSVVGAGATQAAGGGLQLQGTIGQSITGTAKGGTHAGFFGFWYHEGNSVVGMHPTPLAVAATPRIGSLHPNPARDAVTVTVLAAPSESVGVMLVDLLGRVRSRHDLATAPDGVSSLTLPLQGLPPGMYHVMIAGSVGSRGLVIR
jgi:hypothetical protein